MFSWIIIIMIYTGSALMVYNIYGFIRFSRYIKKSGAWDTGVAILNLPIILLVMFLLGYLGIGIFGNPDLLTAAILFGGSIFVFIMYKFLTYTTQHIIEHGELKAELLASEKSNQAKTVFLATMSHEMRTPMNVILGLNELILKDPSLTADTRSKNEKIKRSGEHLLDLINNILDINNLETGEIVCRNKDFSLPKMLDQVSTIANTLCEEKGLDFETSIDPNLAENYIGDNVLIKEILFSLLENAVKYTDVPGRVSFTVSGDCEADILPGICAPSVPVRFIIADTGIGIDKDYLPLIFEKFSQEDASTTNRGGSGLGLATAKETADLLNGRILVESKKNEGSVFTLIVPLAPSSLPEPAGKEIKSGQTDTHLEEVSLEGCRILIVEDIPENAEIVADLLELEDAETEHAENGKIALDMFSASPEGYYDAILMDLRMPILDGLETARKLRGLNRRDAGAIPVIALTANAFESDIQQTIEAGMNAHLAKPVDADAMYDALKYYISNRPDRKERAQ